MKRFLSLMDQYKEYYRRKHKLAIANCIVDGKYQELRK